MVLETRFQTDTGMAVVTDALLVGPDNDDHRLGPGLRTYSSDGSPAKPEASSWRSPTGRVQSTA
jgi:hypothetical protein